MDHQHVIEVELDKNEEELVLPAPQFDWYEYKYYQYRKRVVNKARSPNCKYKIKMNKVIAIIQRK